VLRSPRTSDVPHARGHATGQRSHCPSCAYIRASRKKEDWRMNTQQNRSIHSSLQSLVPDQKHLRPSRTADLHRAAFDELPAKPARRQSKWAHFRMSCTVPKMKMPNPFGYQTFRLLARDLLVAARRVDGTWDGRSRTLCPVRVERSKLPRPTAACRAPHCYRRDDDPCYQAGSRFFKARLAAARTRLGQRRPAVLPAAEVAR